MTLNIKPNAKVNLDKIFRLRRENKQEFEAMFDELH